MQLNDFFLTLVFSASLALNTGTADSPNVTRLREDFESAPTITAIKDDGMWRIHSCGPTEERAAGGSGRSRSTWSGWTRPGIAGGLCP